FSKVMEALQSIPRNDLEFRLEVLKTIKRIFKAHNSTRDIFRHVGGYVSLVSMIVSLEGAFEKPEQFMNDNIKNIESVRCSIIAVLQAIFSVIAESMHDHQANKKYFLKGVGYGSLENAITLTGALNEGCISGSIFGILFGFAMDDESIYELFLNPAKEERDSSVLTALQQRIDVVLKTPSAKVINPEVMPSIMNLQRLISNIDPELSYAVLYAIYALTQANRGNQIKLNTSGLIFNILTRVFPESSQIDDAVLTIESNEKGLLLKIIQQLLSMGISFEELRYMFQRFTIIDENFDLSKSHCLLNLIVQSACQSQWPNFIQFDMATSKIASLEIPELTNFPPTSPGYSLLSWIFIENQDDLSNLSLFSLYDNTSLVFKIYVDAKTKQLRVYNIASKQDIIFKTFQFNIGVWYHIALVHHRPRISIKFSSMDLFINGMHTLEKETINLFYSLGVRYKSLFQDSLHQFQTYETSTSLFLKLKDMIKPTISTRRNSIQTQRLLSDIMKNAHFQRISENKISLALFAGNMLSEGTGLTLTGLSEAAEMFIKTELDYSRLILNSSIPKLDNAIYMPKSMGYLTGESIIAYPYGLDESLWKIGGCVIALKLIEQSKTSETLCKTMTFLFQIIRYSWRNSQDMERCHGYEILAYILKTKRDLITEEIFELLLVFIGKNPYSLEDSMINNPLAYRYIILNFEIWKKTPISVQKAQLDQFILFLETSRNRYFNLKRLPKIHLVKKVLLAFRMNIYAKELTPYFVRSLKAIMLSNWSTDSIRAVATFLASTVSIGKLWLKLALEYLFLITLILLLSLQRHLLHLYLNLLTQEVDQVVHHLQQPCLCLIMKELLLKQR
ncbi:uncharacterized protein BX663DRAFT_435824, partial [Cokeromyces recurvatus]|uniref:uncharacterized protein n=1 Tax=Cokeromyces recurvatus TaxID=90255 RepID=UPI0022205704